jgi:4'-phosphopantetheinyl transferase
MATNPGALTDHDVEVWMAGLDLPPDRIAAYYEDLSPSERARASAFKFDGHRRRYIASQSILRHIISGHYLPVAPRSIQFGRAAKGKPHILQDGGRGPIEFSKSDSQGIGLYAFTQSSDIGVDVEWTRPIPDLESLVESNFSTAEKTAFFALPPEDRLAAFFRCWTQKEAFVKAIGEGLFFPLDRFDVSLAPGGPGRLLHVAGCPDAPSQWRIVNFCPKQGYAAALAVKKPTIHLAFRLFDNVTAS